MSQDESNHYIEQGELTGIEIFSSILRYACLLAMLVPIVYVFRKINNKDSIIQIATVSKCFLFISMGSLLLWALIESLRTTLEFVWPFNDLEDTKPSQSLLFCKAIIIDFSLLVNYRVFVYLFYIVRARDVFSDDG